MTKSVRIIDELLVNTFIEMLYFCKNPKEK